MGGVEGGHPLKLTSRKYDDLEWKRQPNRGFRERGPCHTPLAPARRLRLGIGEIGAGLGWVQYLIQRKRRELLDTERRDSLCCWEFRMLKESSVLECAERYISVCGLILSYILFQ